MSVIKILKRYYTLTERARERKKKGGRGLITVKILQDVHVVDRL